MLPREFMSLRSGRGPTRRPLRVRGDLDDDRIRVLLTAVAAVPWDRLRHAYGPAADVPAQLAAVIAGDDATRDEAWWNLWGNIHHQGTVYEATAPAVPILLAIAGWRAHPDRVLALRMLREVAAADPSLYDAAAPLLDGWRDEATGVRRALLWLLSALPGQRARHVQLIEQTLPGEHRHAWEVVVAGLPESEGDADAVDALEEWVQRG